MSLQEKRQLKQASAGTIAIAVFATIMFVTTRDDPATAGHGEPTIDVGTFEERSTATAGQEKPINVNLLGPATAPMLILGEVESFANDPDQANDPGGNPISYGTPDMSCTIPPDGFGCQLTFKPFSASLSPDTIRIWINGHCIDDTEGVDESTQGGTVAEPDFTEVIQVLVSGTSFGGTATAPDPVPGADPNPPTCTAGGGSPTPTSTGTGTGSPTPTGTGTGTGTTSPTPTGTGTGTGSPTPTGTGTGTGSPTPTGTGTGSPTPTGTGTGSPTGSPTDPGPTFGEMTINVDPIMDVFGTDFLVSGQVTCKDVLVANAEVMIFRRFVGARTINVIETVTDVQGRYGFRDTDLRANSDYSAAWDGRASGSGAAAAAQCSSGAETGSERWRVWVKPGVIANVADATLSRGQNAVFTGAVIPGHAGKKVHLHVFHGQQGVWKYATEATLNRNSRYVIRFPRSVSGYLLFRVAYPTQDLDHAWNISRTIRVDWS